MKALFYTAPLEMTYREAQPQTVEAGEVRVKIEAAGICGSDMHAYHGHDARRNPGLILGHEVCGTIVEGERLGERVVLNPLMTCGRCKHCESGRTNLCPNRTMIGMTRPGGMADEVVLPAANAITVSSSISSAHVSLTEPAACVWHSIELIKRVAFVPIQESCVLVIGGGTIGLLAAKLFQHLGASEVVMIERNPIRQQTAARYRFGQVLGSIEGLADFENSFDIVFDAVGAAVTRRISIEAVRAGGVVLHIGLQSNDGPVDTRKITLQEVSFLGSYTYSEADFSATLNALEAGVFGDLFWVEERPLADGNNAFADLDHGRVAAAKIVLCP
ncbi:MAG: alcohol dehydrogenase catalytic domain-containing protein [Anaerolineae bacterium]